jgi:hypothetical protein
MPAAARDLSASVYDLAPADLIRLFARLPMA